MTTDPKEPHMLSRLNLGRRGTALMLFGLIWLAIGVSTLTSPLPAPGSYWLLTNHTVLQGSLWLATGLLAIACSVLPQGRDTFGFLALYIMAAFRCFAYGEGFGRWVFHSGGDPRGILGVLSWLIVVIIIVLISGWSEPAPEAAP